MIGDPAITSLLLEHGADVHAQTGAKGLHGGHGPTALNIALDTGVFYGDRENLGRSMLAVAEILVERGAEVKGAAAHLEIGHVCKFGGFEDLWERLRKGLGDGEGKKFMCEDRGLLSACSGIGGDR